jgi:hypothetical protein
MLVFVITGVSALAAWRLQGAPLFWPAVINTVVVFWAGGVMSNYAGAPVRGNYERVVITIDMIASLFAVLLLIGTFIW